MDTLKVVAAIFDVDVKDIVLIKDAHIDLVFCSHPQINSLELKKVYAGINPHIEWLGYGAKCSCGKVYFVKA